MKQAIAACLIALSATLPLTAAQATEAAATAKQPAKAEQTVTKVNINTADAQAIADNIKGLGLKKAQRIVDYRDQIGGKFESIDQLLDVKGIGEKTLAKMRQQLTL